MIRRRRVSSTRLYNHAAEEERLIDVLKILHDSFNSVEHKAKMILVKSIRKSIGWAADPTIFPVGWRPLVPVCKVDGATAVLVQITTFIDCQRAFLVKAALMSRHDDSSRHMQPYLPIVVQQSALRNSARLVSFSFFAVW
jgi:hypothetical protein